MFIINLILRPFKWLLGLVAIVITAIVLRRILAAGIPALGLIFLVNMNGDEQSDSSGIHSAVASAATLSPADADGKISINANNPSDNRVLHKEMFGVNSKWLDNGGGILGYGEMIKDRSFRNQSNPGFEKWLAFEEPKINGIIRHIPDSPEHSGTAGGKSYPGHVNISQTDDGFTCLTQLVLGNSDAGEKYQLNVSARRVSGNPTLVGFFANTSFQSIEEVDNFASVSNGEWQDYTFVLEPNETVEPAILRICNMATGSVDVDEIRLHQMGKPPQVREIADERIKELGVQSIRWPSGTDADRFYWKESIGSIEERGENIDTFGNYQTPTWGLHEFLDYCEANDLVPLLTVNVTDSPQNSADLVEYTRGSASTPMGRLRARNGRTQPWDIVHFELGNEPNDAYQGDFEYDDISLGYLAYSIATAQAMRAKADQIDAHIELKGTVESSFTVADWISVVPMLADWNKNVLDPDAGITPYVSQVKGNFYAGFTSAFFKENLYDEIMGGGATLARSVEAINAYLEEPMPFWLTEYSLMVQKSNPTRIEVPRVKDYQAGMSVADLLMTIVKNDFGGAYLFNLAEDATWGITANDSDFTMRPSGLAFSLLTPMAGEHELPVNLTGSRKIKVSGGKGNNPSGIEYDSVSVIASHSEGRVQVFVLNRNWDEDLDLELEVSGFSVASTDIHQLTARDINDNNEEQPDKVTIQSAQKQPFSNVLHFPARSLTRLVLY